MERREFEQLVDEGFDLLPEWVKGKIKNVAILIEDEPSPQIRTQEGLTNDETLLGLYHGIPLTARDSSYGIGMTMPDTITLYQKPIEEEAGSNPAAVQKVIAETVWHEVAHYFGMDEDAIAQREHDETNSTQE